MHFRLSKGHHRWGGVSVDCQALEPGIAAQRAAELKLPGVAPLE